MALSTSTCAPTAPPTVTFQGTVTDDATGKPITNASVSIAQTLLSAPTDGSGVFSLTAASPTSTSALVINAPGYAHVLRWLQPNSPGVSNLSVPMRQLGVVQTIQLPTGSQPPVSVSVSVGDGTVTLTIPPDSLETAGGSTAAGEAQVSATYWNPVTGGIRSAPGLLKARSSANPDVPMNMMSMGMTSLLVTQNNAELQVIPGMSVDLTFQTAPSVAAATTSATWTSEFPLPNVYCLDENTGLWEMVIAGTQLTHPDASTFTASLPHLSDWNLDVGTSDRANGTCMQGELVDQCGAPLPNYQARLMITDFESTNTLTIASDANGAWCKTIGTVDSPWRVGVQTIHYYVGDWNNLSNSSMCNYIPTDAMTNWCQTDPWDGSDCSWWHLNYLYNVGWFIADEIYGACYVTDQSICPDASTCTAPQSAVPAYPQTLDSSTGGNVNGTGTCNVPTICPTTCTFCAGDIPPSGSCKELDSGGNPLPAVTGACPDIGPVAIVVNPNADCTCSNPNNPNNRTEGESCDQPGYVCCGPNLICSDKICVPAQ